MVSTEDSRRAVFIDRPQPKAYDIPWRAHPEPTNPTVRGWVLRYGAILVSYVPFVSKFLWSNAGFAVLRNRPELDDIDARYDPMVIRAADTPATDRDRIIALNEMLGEDWSSKRPPEQEHWTILDYHEAYKSGRLTPIAVARALLPLIRRDVPEASRGTHHLAFLQLREDLTLAAAEASTARYREGKPLSPLDGVPVAIKDELDVSGYHKTFGSTLKFTRDDDATTHCVDLWLRAGAVLMGKTNMHELGSDPLTNNPNHGTPRNPHNAHYYCGGSSGGSAYAVAAGLVPLAEGNDGGGSIRIPSSFCSLYGLKTSCGRLSTRPTCELAKSTSVAGPMAANMLDLEIGFRIMAAPDELNPRSARWAPPHPIPSPSSSSPRPPRVLGLFAPWFDRASPAVQERCHTLITHLTASGHYAVQPITLPLLRPEAQSAHALTILTELLTGVNPGSPHFAALSAPNRLLLSVAQHTSALDFQQAQRLRHLLMRHLADLFDRFPGLVVVTPTTPEAGWEIKPGDLDGQGLSDANTTLRVMEYVHLANFTGCPAITVPAGFVPGAERRGEEGRGRVPVGLMGMGEWGSEEELIAFGYDCERALAEMLKAEGKPKRPVEEGSWVDVMELATGSGS